MAGTVEADGCAVAMRHAAAQHSGIVSLPIMSDAVTPQEKLLKCPSLKVQLSAWRLRRESLDDLLTDSINRFK